MSFLLSELLAPKVRLRLRVSEACPQNKRKLNITLRTPKLQREAL